MAHAILISDHPFLSDLMKVNLQSYLSCKVVTVKNLPTFLQLISVDQTYDFVLALTTLERVDVVGEVNKLHQKYIPEIPIIFLGHTNFLSPEALRVDDPFEIQSVIKVIVKALKWTAKDLMDRTMPEFTPVPLNLLEELSVAMEDLYWKSNSAAEPYTKVANKDDPLKEKITIWQQGKIKELYIKSEFRLRAVAALNQSLTNSLKKAMANPDLSDAPKAVAASAKMFSQCFSDPEALHQLPEEMRTQLIEQADLTAQLISNLTEKMPPSLNNMVELFRKSPGDFIQKHSLLSTYFSIEMVKEESWYSVQVNQKICLLLFFHDIILLPMYQKYKDLPQDEDELKNYTNFKDKDKLIARWHPKLIAQIIQQLPGFSVGLDQLLMQHHGSLNGDTEIDEFQEDVSLLAKVACVAESFAVYLMKSKLPLSEESRDMILKALTNKFKKRSYVKLLEQLKKIPL